MSYMDFSSWPREQEQSFVVFEQRGAESSKKAFMAGLIAAVAGLVLLLAIYAGVEPEHKDVTKGMNMSNLTKKTTATAPKPDVAPAAALAPKTDAPKTDDKAAVPAPAADGDKK